MGFEDFKGYLTTFLLASLFLISLYSFAIGIRDNYGSSTEIVDTEQLQIQNFTQKLNETSSDASKWQEAFTSDNIFIALGGLVLFSIWGIFKLMWTAVNNFATLLLSGATSVLGIDPMVTGTVVALLIIGMIFAVWRVLKIGE